MTTHNRELGLASGASAGLLTVKVAAHPGAANSIKKSIGGATMSRSLVVFIIEAVAVDIS
jgi:hypothetical protein